MAASETRAPCVMHIDMDAFFASVEQRVNPALRGRPVIVGGRPDKDHSIVCAASYEAKARGVKNAMTSAYALRLCPEAVFVPADTAKYVDASRRVKGILEEMFPFEWSGFSIDEFFGLMPQGAGVFADTTAAIRAVKDRIRDELGLTCSVGVAPTRVTAKLASKLAKPDGFIHWDRRQAAAVLRELPVEKLCGIGERLRRRLDALGVRTCGQLAVFPASVLQKHFGVAGLWLQSACRLEDEGGLCWWHKDEETVKSVGHSQTLYAATGDSRRIHAWLHLLCEMVGRRLRRLNRAARTVWVYLSDGFDGGVGRQRTHPAATDDGNVLFKRVVRLLTEMPTPPRVRVLAVSASGLTAEVQDSLFDETSRRRRLLLRAVDRINQRWGEWCVYPARLQWATYGRP